MKFSAAEKELHQATVKALTGAERRLYMARVAHTLGPRSHRFLHRELGWSREALRKGAYELASGFRCVDDYASRGRKPVAAQLPHLQADIRAIAEQHSQTDPTFHSPRLYLRLSAASVRAELLKLERYTASNLPSVEVIRQQLNTLGYTLRAVKKVNP